MAKTFFYQGQEFSPIENSSMSKEKWFSGLAAFDFSMCVENGNWQYDEFLKAASSAGCCNARYFISNGAECFPCTGSLVFKRKS